MRNPGGTFAKGCNHLRKHGKARTPIYGVWRAMLSRCENPNVPAYVNYGGRGIFVCERWHSFENFYADMGERSAGMTLDRINNDGPYAPENCRWADRQAQGQNKRGLRMVTAFGRSRSIAEWSRETGVKLGTIWARLKGGWNPEKAVSTPPVHQRDRAKHNVRWSEPNPYEEQVA